MKASGESMASHANRGFVEDCGQVGPALAGDHQVCAFQMSFKAQHLADHVDSRLNLGPGEGDQPRTQPTGRSGTRYVKNVVPRVSSYHLGEVPERGVQLGDHLFRRSFLRAEYL